MYQPLTPSEVFNNPQSEALKEELRYWTVETETETGNVTLHLK